MTTVFIKALQVNAIVGIHPDERVARQPVVIDIELTSSRENVYTSNMLADTIDYADVARRVTDLVIQGRFSLLEVMAQAIADMLLATYPAERVQVQVAKPRALAQAAAAGIRITRET